MTTGTSALELWGGAECTVRRVGETYYDQVVRSGFDQRLDDIDRFASLGIRAMRFPVLWERTAPDGLEAANWSWPDTRLARLRAHGVAPILGLVHHGSGPRSTGLLDVRLAEKLAEYARGVAERYPWADMYTPINEPLTTARFSALYGHWYPHATDGPSFARAVINQCRATVLAMRAIREVNPHARLVQTEDLGRTYSTPLLGYQAAFENDRRWTTFDLLTGRLHRDDRMWRYFVHVGIPEGELVWFQENSCPPDLLGINHYLTSERFLDPRLWRYPQHTWGGNGRHRYADVEASRVLPHGAAGPGAMLREAWERYRLPLVISEAHNGCTREEQLRWVAEVWHAAAGLRLEGVDVRAVTLWALLGSFDWDTLLTAERGHYEPGAFDVRSAVPRPTALAELARALAAGREPAVPVLGERGWWHRPERFVYGAAVTTIAGSGPARAAAPHVALPISPPLLITGGQGTLGAAFARACRSRGLAARVLTRADADIADPDAIAAAIEAHRPWAIINAAGYVRVDDAETDEPACTRGNATGAGLLADACAASDVQLVTFSSDLVFDGSKSAAYVERDTPAPLNEYGRSKAAAERLVLDAMPAALVVRTSAFFGPWDRHNFVAQALTELAAGRRWAAACNVVSPTYVPDLVNATLDLLIDRERGLWHLANAGSLPWTEFARKAAELAGLDPDAVDECTPAELGWRAERPRCSALDSERAALLPPLDDALGRYMRDVSPEMLPDVRMPAARTCSAAFRPAMNA